MVVSLQNCATIFSDMWASTIGIFAVWIEDCFTSNCWYLLVVPLSATVVQPCGNQTFADKIHGESRCPDGLSRALPGSEGLRQERRQSECPGEPEQVTVLMKLSGCGTAVISCTCTWGTLHCCL